MRNVHSRELAAFLWSWPGESWVCTTLSELVWQLLTCQTVLMRFIWSFYIMFAVSCSNLVWRTTTHPTGTQLPESLYVQLCALLHLPPVSVTFAVFIFGSQTFPLSRCTNPVVWCQRKHHQSTSGGGRSRLFVLWLRFLILRRKFFREGLNQQKRSPVWTQQKKWNSKIGRALTGF